MNYFGVILKITTFFFLDNLLTQLQKKKKKIAIVSVKKA